MTHTVTIEMTVQADDELDAIAIGEEMVECLCSWWSDVAGSVIKAELS